MEIGLTCNPRSKGLEGGELKDRYAAGQYLLDQGELLCKQRALEAYHLNAKEWEVNVQRQTTFTRSIESGC